MSVELFEITNYMDKTKTGKTYSIESACTLLEIPMNRSAYHLKLNENSMYLVYADIDETKLTSDKVIEKLAQNLRIDESEIALSQNENTDCEFLKYHVVIRSMRGTPKAQKQFWQVWNQTYPNLPVDLKVYEHNRFYRLPNQLKPKNNFDEENPKQLQENTRHKILRGNIADFLMCNLETAESEIACPKVEQPARANFEKTGLPKKSADIEKYIDCLSVQRATVYDTWIKVGFALKNIEQKEDEHINLWIKFSKKYELHDDDIQLALTYSKLKPKTADEKGYKLGSLKMWARNDNPELYATFVSDSDDENVNPFAEWEKTHCKILNPPSYLEHKIDGDAERFIIRSTSNLEQSFNHLSLSLPIEKKGLVSYKTVSFIKKWTCLNPDIRKYDEMGIFPPPLVCPDNVFNGWTRFRGDLLPTTANDCGQHLAKFKFLLSVLCGHEETSATYLENWIAQMIQYPAKKTTVPTIISKQGAGKGTLIKTLTALLGENKVLSTTNADVVFGKFNNQMLNAFLVNLDELSPKDVADCEHKIKGLITEPFLSIDIKGVNSMTIKSFHRFINTTNSEFGVFKTGYDDRRNFIVRASDELIGNKKFFTDYNATVIENNEAIKFIYDYLRRIPNLDTFHEAGNIPNTFYGEELKQASRTDYDLWLEDFTRRKSLQNKNVFTSKELYNDFMQFVKKDVFSSKSFGVRILNIVSGGILKGKHTREGETKNFNWIILRKHYCLDCLIDDDESDHNAVEEVN
jgi:hypothetical protein